MEYFARFSLRPTPDHSPEMIVPRRRMLTSKLIVKEFPASSLEAHPFRHFPRIGELARLNFAAVKIDEVHW
jgi:hypothetical protein